MSIAAVYATSGNSLSCGRRLQTALTGHRSTKNYGIISIPQSVLTKA